MDQVEKIFGRSLLTINNSWSPCMRPSLKIIDTNFVNY
jgi:hypothetical protein